MTSSRADVARRRRRASGAAAMLAAIALAGLGAEALGAPPPAPQGPPPVRLLPPKAAPQGKELPPGPPAPAVQPPAPASKLPPPVEVKALQAVDPDSVGVLDEAAGGFGVDMWAGTPRLLVERLLPRIPVGAPSLAMRELGRHLLLSIATAPAGPSGGTSLIALRAERLAAMGDAEGLAQLLDAAPEADGSEPLWRTRVDALLLADETQKACEQVGRQIREHPESYWQRAMIFCQARSGESEQARFGLSLLRDGEGATDPGFFALADLMLGDSTKPAADLAGVTPLEIAMLRAVKQPVPPQAAEGAAPAVLRAIAANPGTDPAVRIRAAELAAAAGALPARALAEAYAAAAFKPDELASALTIAERAEGPLGRALLYQAALEQPIPAARAEAVQAALRSARKSGVHGATARAMAPLLDEIMPSPDRMWFAAEAGRALLASGERGEAKGWYELASAARDGEARKAQLVLWPLMLLTEGAAEPNWDREALEQWLATAREAGGEDWQARVALVLSVFDGLGAPLEPADWAPVVGPEHTVQPMPGAALWTALWEAADAERRGETVLLALLALGEGGPVESSPIVVNAVLTCLRSAGLGEEARSLAVEALLAAL